VYDAYSLKAEYMARQGKEKYLKVKNCVFMSR